MGRHSISPRWVAMERNIHTLCLRVLRTDQKWDGIIAVTRGGLIPAGIIAQQLKILFVDTICISSYQGKKQLGEPTLYKRTHPITTRTKGEGYLVVDDICDTGQTFIKVKETFPYAHYAAVFCKPLGKQHCDFYGAYIPQDCWVTFPWERDGAGVDGAETRTRT